MLASDVGGAKLSDATSSPASGVFVHCFTAWCEGKEAARARAAINSAKPGNAILCLYVSTWLCAGGNAGGGGGGGGGRGDGSRANGSFVTVERRVARFAGGFLCASFICWSSSLLRSASTSRECSIIFWDSC
eukprot:49786-Prymnesium_polylepis.2